MKRSHDDGVLGGLRRSFAAGAVPVSIYLGLCTALIFPAMRGGSSQVNAASLSGAVGQQPVASEKERRTAAQHKIDSRLLYEIYRADGTARQKQVPPGDTGVKIDPKGRALVDVRADVTPNLEKALVQSGGTIVSTSREYHSILAWVPLLKLERLAKDRAVRAIGPAAEATTR